MKNSELRKIANRNMKGKLAKAGLFVTLYIFIVGLLNSTCVGVILGVPLSFGLIKMIVHLEEGKDVKAFDFFTHGMDNFGKSWCVQLLVYLRILIPAIFLVILTGIAVFLENEFFNIILIVFEVICAFWSIFILLKYSLVNYELLYHPEMKARDIVKQYNEKIKGNTWKVIRMNIYYSLILFIPLVVIPILGIFSLELGLNLFSNEYEKAFLGIFLAIFIIFIMAIVYMIFSIFISSVVQPRLITANNELYKDLSDKSNLE